MGKFLWLIVRWILRQSGFPPFCKSIRALGALFGHPTCKPAKQEMVVLFRVKEITDLSLDNRGAAHIPQILIRDFVTRNFRVVPTAGFAPALCAF